MSAREIRFSARIDRRGFLIGTGAGLAAASVQASAFPLSEPKASLATQRLDDWTIDDMWTGYPRPHDCLGSGGRAAASSCTTAHGNAAPGSIEALFG